MSFDHTHFVRSLQLRCKQTHFVRSLQLRCKYYELTTIFIIFVSEYKWHLLYSENTNYFDQLFGFSAIISKEESTPNLWLYLFTFYFIFVGDYIFLTQKMGQREFESLTPRYPDISLQNFLCSKYRLQPCALSLAQASLSTQAELLFWSYIS